MPGPEFFQTRMGVRFFESDLPKLIAQLSRLNDNLEKMNAPKPEISTETRACCNYHGSGGYTDQPCRTSPFYAALGG